MNRRLLLKKSQPLRVPYMCGDEPIVYKHGLSLHPRSLHVWG